ncbi:50S ribosomal protein L2 [Neisseria elongata subsp. glycolytica ATCC 29315]|uniref:50S ribosomal protein L2 n=1 Tax=Neisseria elongata subsp. glycolytica ATCC 29315 TaxID=546263 RepID=D4DRM7_NEIEG|nr:50S ribosomal protein L2 [Neisseria elongata subsp. glycolytica ATCC 29315]
MAIVKMKPTSAGRRGMVRVTTEGLHKGAPFAALVEKKKLLPDVIIMAISLPVTKVVVTNIIIVW